MPVHHEVEIFKPIIKDLAAEQMSSNSPTIFIPPFFKPVVPKCLRIEVMNLERGVVHMCCWSLVEEEAMMVNQLATAIKVHESRYVLPALIMNELKMCVSNKAARRL